MPNKAKSKKPPAKSNAKPLRGARLIRQMFAEPKAAYTIDQLVAALGHKGKTPKATASAIMSVLANPAKTDNPLKITLDRATGKYSVTTAVAGANSSAGKAKGTSVGGADSSAKKGGRKAAASKGVANGCRAAA